MNPRFFLAAFVSLLVSVPAMAILPIAFLAMDCDKLLGDVDPSFSEPGPSVVVKYVDESGRELGSMDIGYHESKGELFYPEIKIDSSQNREAVLAKLVDLLLDQKPEAQSIETNFHTGDGDFDTYEEAFFASRGTKGKGLKATAFYKAFAARGFTVVKANSWSQSEISIRLQKPKQANK